MSEVKNVTASFDDLVAKFAPAALPPERRAKLIAEIATFTGDESFTVVEGCLILRVPHGVALEHLDDSLLISMLVAMNDYARVLVRAAAICPREVFRDWLDKRTFDQPGQFIDLLDDGRVRFVPLALCRDDAAQDALVEEGAPAGVVRDDAAGKRLDDPVGAVADHRLLHGQSDSLNHPEPLVPRRSTPPP